MIRDMTEVRLALKIYQTNPVLFYIHTRESREFRILGPKDISSLLQFCSLLESTQANISILLTTNVTPVQKNSLLNHPLNAIQPHLQRIHLWSITEAYKMMTRTIKQITSLARVQIEENPRHDNNALFETRLEEIQSIADRRRETLEIQPQVESTVWYGFDVESHSA